MLYLPQFDCPWRLRTDAWNYAIQGALEQQQEDGRWHPVAFFLSRNRADAVVQNATAGQCVWTSREQETYGLAARLLKIQSLIERQEVQVQTDQSAIVKWYKEDVCTISGPPAHCGRWHKIFSSFNLAITHRPSEENKRADCLPRWA